MRFETDAGVMNRTELIDEYFIENRTKLLDIAAFLDRLDRAKGAGAGDDYRMAAYREAVLALSDAGPCRVTAIQMIFSDPTTAPLESLDQPYGPHGKSALGAYDRGSREGR